MRSVFVGSAVLLALTGTSVASAAPPAPKGPHPRLFLGATTLKTMKAKAVFFDTAARRAIDVCVGATSNPASIAKSGYQGDTWAFTLSSCALAYQLTGAKQHAETGVKLWKAILGDRHAIGDGEACVAGASEAQAIASIKRDSGYAIRFIGPHTALAYDWLHDAPGVDEALRAQSRACFKSWLEWYAKSGYLAAAPGSNYHAGFVAAKSLIAVAEGGEDGATSDKLWTEAVDDLMGKQIVGKGLSPKGALQGGDWAEGWQYGPLSAIHYALAARALEEQGAKLPEMHQWASDLTLRFVYGLTPTMDATWVGGDSESLTPYIAPNTRVLTATLAGPGSEQAAGWATFLRGKLGKEKDLSPVFDALTEARTATAVDPHGKLPLWYVAKGTRNVYARSSFARDAFWAVFSSAPHVVPDHQHNDATNFVLSRGADHLVVDPSPYGSLSSLTSNAIAVDSPIAIPAYRPSQTSFSQAELAFVRGTKGGVVAARSDFAKAFNFADKPSDVPFARRDWVFTPEGEIVTLDRTRTDAIARKTYLRFRTPAKLTLSGKVASGKVGTSLLAIHQVKVSGGTAAIKSYPAHDSCDSKMRGGCTHARFAVDEYSLEIPGPRALAIHALDALGVGESPAEVTSLNDAPIDVPPQNDGVLGAAVRRGNMTTYVVASSANDGVTGATMTYGVPGGTSSRHVVFDAPADAAGKSKVVVTASGGRCLVTITPGGSFLGLPLMFSVSSAAEGCKATDEPDAPPGSVVAQTTPGSHAPDVAWIAAIAFAMRRIRVRMVRRAPPASFS